MKQQVEITMTVTLWLNAAMTEDAIVTHVRARLPDAFGEDLTAVTNPVDVLSVRQEAEVYVTREVPPDPDGRNEFEAGRLFRAAPKLLAALDALLEQTVDTALNNGFVLTEGEEAARAMALAAINEAVGS